MSDQLNRLAGSTAKPLRIGLLGFAIAAIGAAIAFLIDYGPGDSLSYLAFGLVCLGVAIGFLGLAWSWIAAAKKSVKKSSDI